jgi:hypothetical protein
MKKVKNYSGKETPKKYRDSVGSGMRHSKHHRKLPRGTSASGPGRNSSKNGSESLVKIKEGLKFKNMKIAKGKMKMSTDNGK